MNKDLGHNKGVPPSGSGHSDEPASGLAAVAGSVPNAIGPEMAELLDRHGRDGVVHWHADRLPDATDEQVAAELNRLVRHLAVPENRVAGLLHGEAFILRDSANCTLRRFDCASMSAIVPNPMEYARAKSQLRLADLLCEAAEMLERSVAAPIAGE